MQALQIEIKENKKHVKKKSDSFEKSNEDVNFYCIANYKDDEIIILSFKQIYDLIIKVRKENDELEKKYIMTYKNQVAYLKK